ncbi:FAD-dependent oxidoreductase [Collinsella sp. AGMB00827]|uniref:FAD-dependent oxidoreductase n=1 Tax=Collinsella ureilytica TaxID=2869515 RepID=A0ABS7MHK3_9ACTN|nr:FAD-dependent oxidoreductase [Collinsella urealyticum]MBY4796842.1 FAD-dependent oxidoreductase [Collinsella urealyticum]
MAHAQESSVSTADNFDPSTLYDAVIIGGGPAGLTAAIYLARARYRVLVVEKERFGGQITITDEVVNYPGVLSASGTELTETMRKQAEAFGAEFLLAEVSALQMEDPIKRVQTSRKELHCFAVLLATGASPRSAGFIGEEEYRGRGVAYCATCDGEFFSGKDVIVVGGGFAAAEEAVFLTRYARRVRILVREPDFTCAPAVAEEAKRHEKIDVYLNTEVCEVGGDGSKLSFVRYRNTQTDKEETFRSEDGSHIGVFVFAGYAPATDLVRDLATLDEHGYVLADAERMSGCDGLFAAGDVCAKRLRQVATAVGDAAETATVMERFLQEAQEKTGLHPTPPVSRPTHKPASAVSHTEGTDGGFIDEAMRAQLAPVFERMAAPVILRLHLDSSSAAAELGAFMDELAAETEKLSVERVSEGDQEYTPFVELIREDGTSSGLAFHGVPGGHEFTSFILGIYNVAGPGQQIDDAARTAIASIAEPITLKILVSLSCTMCPETVLSAQRIAAEHPLVSAEVFDVARFPELRERFGAMSVPCVVIEQGGSERTIFGRKDLPTLLAELV